MTTLKIHRINKSNYEVRNGNEVVRKCGSFKEAQNALICEDIILLDSVDEYFDTELDDLDLMYEYNQAA